MQSDFISPSDSRWNEALCALRHDVYDLPEYVAACGSYEKATPVAFYAREGHDRALIPLLQRPLPSSLGAPSAWCDATSPYGYSSALFTDNPQWPARAIQAFLDACNERQLVSVFVRLHPLLASASALDIAGPRVRHGQTVYVDLTVSEDILHDQQRGSHRYDIRRLRSQGFTVLVDAWSDYQPFMEIYGETMSRLNADSYYVFPAEYFRDLRGALGPRLHLFSVRAPDLTLAAAGLFTETEGIVEYHLSGTAHKYRHLAPSKLMLAAAIKWAKDAGNRVLHLGGGVGSRDDALFRFKAGFSGLTSPFQTWRVICNRQRYDKLTQVAAALSSPIEGFFPAYGSAKWLTRYETHLTISPPHERDRTNLCPPGL